MELTEFQKKVFDYYTNEFYKTKVDHEELRNYYIKRPIKRRLDVLQHKDEFAKSFITHLTNNSKRDDEKFVNDNNIPIPDYQMEFVHNYILPALLEWELEDYLKEKVVSSECKLVRTKKTIDIINTVTGFKFSIKDPTIINGRKDYKHYTLSISTFKDKRKTSNHDFYFHIMNKDVLKTLELVKTTIVNYFRMMENTEL